MRKTAIIAAIVAAVIALSLSFTPSAEAATLSAGSVEPRCSLPYVDDVNEWSKNNVILTVYCCGNAKSYDLKVVSDKGKKAKAVRSKRHRNVWTVVVKKNRVYKLSVRAKGGKWKSIKYGIC